MGVRNTGVDEELRPSYRKKNILTQTIVNILPQVMFTKHFLGKFRDRKLRSACINISSISADGVNGPMNPQYCATKSFNDFLSNSEKFSNVEYPNVDWISMKPGIVVTKMYYKSRNSIFFFFGSTRSISRIFIQEFRKGNVSLWYFNP